ncbi:Uncharacterised protein [Mycobacteroides abscessus]|nr:Uncharacterised protein [Mycobacteroides abscessus]
MARARVGAQFVGLQGCGNNAGIACRGEEVAVAGQYCRRHAPIGAQALGQILMQHHALRGILVATRGARADLIPYPADVVGARIASEYQRRDDRAHEVTLLQEPALRHDAQYHRLDDLEDRWNHPEAVQEPASRRGNEDRTGNPLSHQVGVVFAKAHHGHAAHRMPDDHDLPGGNLGVDEVGSIRGELTNVDCALGSGVGLAVSTVVERDDAQLRITFVQRAGDVVPGLAVLGPAVQEQHGGGRLTVPGVGESDSGAIARGEESLMLAPRGFGSGITDHAAVLTVARQ